MGRFSKFIKKETVQYRAFEDQQVTNFMNGISYEVNPLNTLKIVAASSIFGEPSYYRKGLDAEKYIDKLLPEGFRFVFHDTKTTTDVFNAAIDEALSFDFKATLDLAKELRHDYFMRLNPSLILVKACMHKDRATFSALHGDYLRKIGRDIIRRPDDITNQFELYMFLNGSKKNMPSVLKRIWKDKMEGFSRYQLNKYKSKSLIDIVRICHANNELIDELMQTGKVEVKDDQKTWENLRSAQYGWDQIWEMTYIPHMALLRNLRNIFQSDDNALIKKIKGAFNAKQARSKAFANEVLTQLENGVIKGKQFPFRYYSAYKEIKKANVYHKDAILKSLNKCLDISVANFPKLSGKTICLCDNSGSAWGAVPSTYGSMTVATIANLSSIITALQSDEGYVGVFGDRLDIQPVSRRTGILDQLEGTNQRGKKQGQSTENGIWLFFSQALKGKVWYDNIFIYSDMQAGHGGLYGTDVNDYKDFTTKSRYIDVLKLVLEYRKLVNPKVNVFSVQVAGYKNSVVPENLQRTSILTGWTGKEAIYANYVKNLWDEAES